MPRLVPALILSATLLLSGCNAPTTKPAEATPEADPAERQLAAIQKNVKEWQKLSEAEIEPVGESAGTFSAEQIEQISMDVLKIAETQLDANQATSQEEVEQQADIVINAAPRTLRDYMAQQAQQDEKDKRNDIMLWSMAFAQPISESYEIEDDSRLTYAWSVDPGIVGGQDGVTVTLFTRTTYLLTDSEGGRNALGIGRWVSLGTSDPAYTTSTGDYAWNLNYRIYNADVCSLAKHGPLKADNSLNRDDLSKITAPEPSKFVSLDKFKIDEEELESAVAKCDL